MALDLSQLPDQPSKLDLSSLPDQPDDLPKVVVTQPQGPEGKGFTFLPRSGAQMDTEEARQAADIAQPIIENPQVGGVVTAFNRAIPRSLSDLVRLAILPREGNVDEQNRQDEEWGKSVRGEYGPVEQAATLTGTAMAATPLLHIPFREGIPPPLRTEPLMPDPPPTQSMGPGTTAADVSNALDWTPDSAPVTPLEETIAKVQPPGPFVSPETGFTIHPGLEEGHVPIPAETASFRQMLLNERARIEAQIAPSRAIGQRVHPDIENRLAEINKQLGYPQEAPVNAQEAPAAEVPASKSVPVAETPAEPYTPEAAAQRAQQQSSGAGPATKPVGGNVAGFSETYGPGEIPPGPTLTPEDAWDLAHERAVTQKSQPYGFVDRARTGAITPTEMGDLIYEHHRLVERAAAVEGTPAYDGAYQAARTFAENVLKPAENAWHRSGQTMQIARPVNFETQTGMNLAAERMKTEIKASEKAAAERHVKENAKAAKDVQKSEGELVKAMDKEYAKGAKRPPKTAEQLRKQLAETEPCVL